VENIQSAPTAFGKKVSMPLVHSIAALIFAALGILALLNVGNLF